MHALVVKMRLLDNSDIAAMFLSETLLDLTFLVLKSENDVRDVLGIVLF